MILSETSSRYRNKLEIVKDILSILEVAGAHGTKKTHIMYGANLSYKLLEKYIEEVIESGLIYTDERSIYFITDKGKEFLKIYMNYETEMKVVDNHLLNIKNGKDELKKMLE
jgi:predicted transcriptional regulator